MKNIATTVISLAISKGQQDVVYVEVLRLLYSPIEHVLRINIRSDSYAFQCHARIERFDGAQWHPLHDIHHGVMATPSGLVYRREQLTGEPFKVDRDELLDVAVAMLTK